MLGRSDLSTRGSLASEIQEMDLEEKESGSGEDISSKRIIEAHYEPLMGSMIDNFVRTSPISGYDLLIFLDLKESREN